MALSPVALRIAGAAVAALALSACVTTNAVLLNPAAAPRPKVPPDSVRVFMVPGDVPGAYEQIAFITAEGSAEWTDQSGMVEAMRRKAGDLGANGIILGGIDEPSSGAQVAAAIFGTGTTRRGRVLAIRWNPAARDSSR